MDTLHVSKNDESDSKKALIQEIESLLNAIPASSHIVLSPHVMSVLSCADLEHIRNNLLEKSNNVIAHNKEWLLGLCDD